MGLRQALMALMEWATNVPQKLLQCDAIHFSLDGGRETPDLAKI